MAVHPLEPDSVALITDVVGSRGDPFTALRTLLQLVVRKINGLLTFGSGRHGTQAGNFHGQWMYYVAPATPEETFGVPHGLGRVPTAVFPAVTQVSPSVADGRDDKGYLNGTFVWAAPETAWTTEMVWLKCNVPSVKLALLIV